MKKGTNKNILAIARVRKDPTRDEFYTTRESAEKFLVNVKPEFFFGKTVYCNCDGRESEIFKLLCERFDQYRLKKIYAAKYCKDGNGTKITYDGKKYVFEKMAGDGSFDSEESINILDESDVVVTNPPFSRQLDLVDLIYEKNKYFIIIGNLLGFTSDSGKNIRKYLLRCSLFNVNYNISQGMTFRRPNGDVAEVLCGVFSNAADCINLQDEDMLKFSYDQLDKSGKIEFDDKTGILNVNYLKYIPLDYDKEIYAPISAAINLRIRRLYDIIDISNKVYINGRRKFWRVLVKRKK